MGKLGAHQGPRGHVATRFLEVTFLEGFLEAAVRRFPEGDV